MRFEYDEETKGKYPFWIEKLTPIQLATFDLEEYRKLRTEFTTDDWLDFMVRSMGYESSAMERRLKLLFLTRLIPLCWIFTLRWRRLWSDTFISPRE